MVAQSIQERQISRRQMCRLLQGLAQRNAFLERRHGKGIGAHGVGQENGRRYGSMTVPIGLDDHDDAAPLSIGRRFDFGVVVGQSRQTDSVDGTMTKVRVGDGRWVGRGAVVVGQDNVGDGRLLLPLLLRSIILWLLLLRLSPR